MAYPLASGTPLRVATWRTSTVTECKPFSLSTINPLRLTLGSTNPGLTTHRPGNLAPSAERSFTALCCYYYQDLHTSTVDMSSPTCFCPCPSPDYQFTWFFPTCSEVSVVILSPVHFLGPPSRELNCYVLLRGWLFLSLPDSCFREQTPF